MKFCSKIAEIGSVTGWDADSTAALQTDKHEGSNSNVDCLPSTLMDLEHFMLIFLARRSNHDPIFCPPEDKEEKVFDFCSTLISILLFLSHFYPTVHREQSGVFKKQEGGRLIFKKPVF